VLGFGFSAATVWLITQQFDLHGAARALAQTRPGYAALGVLFVVLAYAMRITRWWAMLRALSPSVPLFDCVAPFLISIAVNNVAPLRAGDVVRAIGFSGQLGIAATSLLATVLLERLLDLAVLVALAFMLIAALPAGTLPPAVVSAVWLAAGIGMTAAVILLTLPRPLQRAADWTLRRPMVQRSRLLAAGVRHANTLLATLSSVSSPRLLALLLPMSLMAWLLEGGAFAAVAWDLGPKNDLLAPYAALAVGTLSTLVPSAPGYVGTFHYAVATTVQAFGWPAAEALAFAVAVHLLLWISTTAAGFSCLAWRQLRMRRVDGRR
jgi:uncharacterized protein (TIRG00374 family)